MTETNDSILKGFFSVTQALTKAIVDINEAHPEDEERDYQNVLLDMVIMDCIRRYSRWDTLPEDGSIENRMKTLVTEVLNDEGFDYE